MKLRPKPSSIPIFEDTVLSLKDLSIGFNIQSRLQVRISYKSLVIDNIFFIDVFDADNLEARIFIEGVLQQIYQSICSEGRFVLITSLFCVGPGPDSGRIFTAIATERTTISTWFEDKSIPRFPKMDLRSFHENNSEYPPRIDFLAKVMKIVSKKSLTNAKGQSTNMKEIYLQVDNGKEFSVQLWKDMSERFDCFEGQLILCRGLRYNKIQGTRFLTTGDTAFISRGVEEEFGERFRKKKRN